MITWLTTTDAIKRPGFNGTCFLTVCELSADKLAALARAAGVDALDRDNYWDTESGYDGWELHGLFNDAPFTLYTRFGQLRIGGHLPGDAEFFRADKDKFVAVHVESLVAALTEALK